MRKYQKHFEYQMNYNVDINSFYKNLNGTSFKSINKENLQQLIIVSKSLNAFYNNESLPIIKVNKYVKIMNRIKSNPKGFGISSNAEKYLLFMFSVDPNFEAAKIYGSYNKTEDIKREMRNFFGVYDNRLITLEKYFIKYFLSEKKRNEINEEIEKRVYK